MKILLNLTDEDSDEFCRSCKHCDSKKGYCNLFCDHLEEEDSLLDGFIRCCECTEAEEYLLEIERDKEDYIINLQSIAHDLCEILKQNGIESPYNL